MAGTVTMVVSDGWAVYVDGQQRTGGQTIEVPAADAERYARRGWATPTAKPRKAPSRTR